VPVRRVEAAVLLICCALHALQVTAGTACRMGGGSAFAARHTEILIFLAVQRL
jgi:hypothetical protein